MHDYFYFSTELHQFLFGDVDVVGLGPFICLCIGVSLLAIGLEGLRVVRTLLSRVNAPSPAACSPPPARVPTRCVPNTPGHSRPAPVQKLLHDAAHGRNGRLSNSRILPLVFESIVHMVHACLGYILMLIVMTFNAYIFISIIFAVGIGYFLFGSIDFMLSAKRNRYLNTLAIGGLDRVVRVAPKRKTSDYEDPRASGTEVEEPIICDGAVVDDYGTLDPTTTSDVAGLLVSAEHDEVFARQRTGDCSSGGLLTEQIVVDIHT